MKSFCFHWKMLPFLFMMIPKMNLTFTMGQQRIESTLVGMTAREIEELILGLNEPGFRAVQIYHWVYKHQVESFDDMKNIPRALRKTLSETVRIHPLQKKKMSGTPSETSQKFLFQLSTGESIESVLIKENGRVTVCVSTQVGCAVDCAFCATAKMGFKKNLTAGEIVDQVIQIQQDISDRISNIVFMGMGEPFLNYAKSMESAKLMNDPDGLNIGARKITISTSGIIPKIRQFTLEQHRYKLAISLNASSQEQRLHIMPIARKYSLVDLMDASREYFDRTRNHVTFEYVLMDRFNDTPGDAKRLIRLIGNLPCKLNVIPYNDIGGDYERPESSRIDAFLSELEQAPFTVTVRWSKGTDIHAGCGQLATEAI